MFGLTQTVKDYRETIRRLPLVLNLAWLAMHLGVGIAIFGFLKRSGTHGLVGAGLLLLGVVISMIDSYFRNGDRRMTAYFSTAMFVSALAGIVGAGVFTCLLLLANGAAVLFGWFSWHGLWSSFHFFGLALTVFFVTGLASQILSSWGKALIEEVEEK